MARPLWFRAGQPEQQMTEAEQTCSQAVLPDDDCCAGHEVCGLPASWVHRLSGAMLCDLHESNARKYHGDRGHWGVGKLLISYPDGWERLDGGERDEASAGLEIVRLDS